MSKIASTTKHLLDPTAAIQELERLTLQLLVMDAPMEAPLLDILLKKPASKGDHLTGVYCSALTGIFSGNRFRAIPPSQEEALVLFEKLKAWHLALFEFRFDEVSGLLYLLAAEESVLPKASYWTDQKEPKLAEPAFLSLIAWSLELLIHLGGSLKQDISLVSEYLEVLVYSMNEQLWDDEYGLYFPKNLSTGNIILTDSIGGLFPLLADIPDQDQAEAMYRTLSNNFVQGKHFYFPTECVIDGTETKMVDPLVNYLMFFGLTRFEFSATAKALRQHTEYLIEHYGYQRSFDSKRELSDAPTEKVQSKMIETLHNHFLQAKLTHYSNLG
jgi:hypothetical protein